MFHVIVAASLLCGMAAGQMDSTMITGSSAASNLMDGLIEKFPGMGSFTYQPEGSGAGQDFVADGDGPLGVGDVPFPSAPTGVLQMPFALGAIAVYANTGGSAYSGGLTAEQICGIYSGETASWSDIDPSLPDAPPVPIGRSDSSGSTAVFTEWLTNACASFAPGQGQQVMFDSVVETVDGTSAVIDKISSTVGAIGYAACGREDGDAAEIALINSSESALLCAEGDYTGLEIDTPARAADDFSSVSPVGLPGPQAYPTTFLLYAYLADDLSAFADATAVTDFVSYVLDAGQSELMGFSFFPAPDSVLVISKAGVDEVVASMAG